MSGVDLSALSGPIVSDPAHRIALVEKTGAPAVGEITTPTATEPAARLLLLDGHSMAYWAFFALPGENFPTPSGVTTNAVFGFTSMLINVVRDEAPTHLAVAFDVSRASLKRTKM